MAITITTPVIYRVFQRSGTTGNIAITGTYTGSPTAIEASFNGGAYATIDAAPTGGNYGGTLSSQAQGQGTLTVRFTNDTAQNANVTYIGIGDVFILAGQSNASGYGNGANYYYHPTLKAGLFGNDYNWKELADFVDSATNQVDTVSSDPDCNGSGWPILATYLMQALGVPVAFVPCALTSTSVANWQPGANHQDRTTLYGSMVYRALQTGVKCVLWWQGEQDALDGTSEATYNSNLDSLANAVNADLGVKLMPCKIFEMDQAPYVANNTNVNNAINTAWGDNSNVLAGPDFSNLAASVLGGIHYGRPHSYLIAERWYAAIRAAFNFSDTIVQTALNYFSGSSGTCVFKKNVTSGNLIVVAVGQYGGTIMGSSAISDNHSNTYTLIGTVASYSGDSALRLGLYYAYNVTGGAMTITFTGSDATSISLAIHEFSGILTSDPLDKNATGNTSTPDTAITSGNTTTTAQADELLFGACAPYASTWDRVVPGSSYRLRSEYPDPVNQICVTTEDRVVAATGAYAATFTQASSVGYIAKVATFKLSAAALSINVTDIDAYQVQGVKVIG